jgi:hypothetical protein
MELAQKALAQSFAQQAALMALVITHPDPARFAAVLEQIWTHGQLQQLSRGPVAADVKAAGLALYEELRDIARMEAERRARPPTP